MNTNLFSSRNVTLAVLLTLTATLSPVIPASADVIPTLQSITGNAATGYDFNYRANLTVDQRLETGDYFTIYDFAGYIPGFETNPAGWSFAAQSIGTTPSWVVVPDSPALTNLTWTWNGGTTPGGPMYLGLFTARSQYDGTIFTPFTGLATRDNGPSEGTKIANIGTVGAPASNLPEPGTVSLLCAALPGIMFIGLRRRA